MTAPSLPALRPLGIGELLDQSIRLYRRNFLRFIGILALVHIPLSLIELALSLVTTRAALQPLSNPGAVVPGEIFSPGNLLSLAASLLSLAINFVLIRGLATAALTRAIADNRLGLSTEILEAYRKTIPIWARLILALLLLGLILVGVGIWTLVPCAGWISGPGALVVLAWVIGSLVTPIIVLENKGAADTLRRAWDLTRRRFWWIIGFLFLLYLFAFLVVTGPTSLISTALSVALRGRYSLEASTTLNLVIQSLAALVLNLIYLPLQITAITLMYFDLRVRTEGFDLALQASSNADPRAGMQALLTQAPPPATGSLLRGPDMINFIVLTLGAGLAYAILVGILGLTGVLLFSMMG